MKEVRIIKHWDLAYPLEFSRETKKMGIRLWGRNPVKFIQDQGFGATEADVYKNLKELLADKIRRVQSIRNPYWDNIGRFGVSIDYWKSLIQEPITFTFGQSCLGQILDFKTWLSTDYSKIAPIFIPDNLPEEGAYFVLHAMGVLYTFWGLFGQIWISQDGLTIKFIPSKKPIVEFKGQVNAIDSTYSIGYLYHFNGVDIIPNYIPINNPNGYIPTT